MSIQVFCTVVVLLYVAGLNFSMKYTFDYDRKWLNALCVLFYPVVFFAAFVWDTCGLLLLPFITLYRNTYVWNSKSIKRTFEFKFWGRRIENKRLGIFKIYKIHGFVDPYNPWVACGVSCCGWFFGSLTCSGRLQPERTLVAGPVCDPCAKRRGATWPTGHIATMSINTCDLCGKEDSCADASDYNWPKGFTTKAREF